MQVVCDVESCGLCYEESLKPPPPWACDSCHLVNWPRWDGSSSPTCRGCGVTRVTLTEGVTRFTVTIGGVDVTPLVVTEEMTMEQFEKTDPWEV